MGAERYKLVIIGSGFAAVALMLHLFRQDSPYAGSLAVIGPAPLGGGGAYHTAHPDFRLNVRAELMRLYEDEEQNFARWADSNLSDPQAATPQGQFFRRHDFHRYLLAECERMNVSDKSIHIDDMAVSVTPPASQPEGVWQIECRSGRTFWAEKIVLATGNPPPRWPCQTDANLSFHSGLVEQPWQGEWCQAVSADDTAKSTWELAEEWKRIRAQRNRLLSESDWTQGGDSPLTTQQKSDWAVYRTSLRTLPEDQSSVTSYSDINWPTKPS